MCLFLTALLRDGRIGLDEYGIEIQEFCVNNLWVVEAAEVPIASSISFGEPCANFVAVPADCLMCPAGVLFK